ncbi:B-cell receptor CD22-like, partial [Neolamprologus brichardi]|uniref:B-cell receptor CD22-like n=1 Tax=Neolamprologus brichardi TaxID=32507 RepID=UPI001643CA52
MLCDLPADGIYETRGAAMSSTAAATGLFLFLLSLPVVQSQNDYAVTYTSTQICAVKGSTVVIGCWFNYPSRVNVLKRVWFTKVNNYNPEDLKTDPAYAGRVSYSSHWKNCTLTIRDLRESDSAVYKFKFETDWEDFIGLPGVTLTVTALQVHVDTSSNSNWATLTCQSSCRLHDHSSYIWYKNGHKVSSRNQNRYSVNLKPSDSYSCAVRGREDFPSPSVCVRGGTTLTVTDVQVSVSTGGQLYCVTRCDPYVSSYVWYKNGQQVIGARSSSYDVPYDTSNSYSCALKGFEEFCSALVCARGDSCNRVNYSNRSIFPRVKVSRIISVHESQTEAELKCESSCSPAGRLSFVWFKNNQFMVEQSSYQDLFNPGDIISCAFKGHEDYPSDPVYAPKFASVLVLNNSHEIVEGSSVNLTCSSDANPAANYTWYKDKKPISTEQRLIFRSIQSSDSGEYHCTAKNELGQRPSEVIFINVKYAPKLASVSVSPSAEIVEDSSVNLTCSSDANPAANYTWYKENKLLLHGPAGRYHLSSISSEDSGNYSCKAENLYGPAQSVTLYIDVEYRPRLPSVSVSPSAEIVEGSSVTLTCSSDANPAANYTWYKEDEESPKASGQNFTITDFRPEHIGSYYCVAQNTRGHHNSTLQLIVTA